MIRFASVQVGQGAPLGCARCAMPPTPAYHPVEQVATALAACAATWVSTPGPNVVLGGPEPFAHPHLPALVAAAREAGFERIALETDGAALSAAGNADGVLGAGVRHLWLRVVTTDEQRGASLVPRPAATGAARDGVAAYLAAAEEARLAVVVTAIVPVCAHTLPNLSRTVADLASWGAHAVRLVGAGPLPAAASAVIAAACDTGMVNRLWVETDGAVPLLPSHRLHEAAEADAR